MKWSKTTVDVHPTALLNRARNYRSAADLLLDTWKKPVEEQERPLDCADSIYFLYYHSVELALKAFLRSHQQPVSLVHAISDLYQNCKQFGKSISGVDERDFLGVVQLLEQANKNQGLRYPLNMGRAFPDLNWTREVVERLLQSIEPGIQSRSDQHNVGGRGYFDITFGRPEPKPKDVALTKSV
jgi:hypothetical protein